MQVDFRTRARIAHAARKVLEAREVQRRAHQGNTLLQGQFQVQLWTLAHLQEVKPCNCLTLVHCYLADTNEAHTL